MPIVVPGMAADLELINYPSSSINETSWYAGAYYIGSCASQLNWNQVYEFHRPRIPFLVALLLFGAGSAISATARSTQPFIIGRAIAGLAVPGLHGGCTVVLETAIKYHKGTLVAGLASFAAGLGYVAGPLVGGSLTAREKGSWRLCFYLM